VQTTYTYEPFGTSAVTGQTNTNSYQYTGRENDGTGLDYYRARYYYPARHRFISEDPIGFAGGDPNLYAYAFNDPVALTDPSGELVPQLIGCAIGGSLAYALGGRKLDVLAGCVLGALGLPPVVRAGGGAVLAICARFPSACVRLVGAGATLGGLPNIRSMPPISGGSSIGGGLADITHAGSLTAEQAMANGARWLGSGYREIAPGVFRSADGFRQFRMTTADIIGAHGQLGSHVHFEALNQFGRVVENNHVPLR